MNAKGKKMTNSEIKNDEHTVKDVAELKDIIAKYSGLSQIQSNILAGHILREGYTRTPEPTKGNVTVKDVVDVHNKFNKYYEQKETCGNNVEEESSYPEPTKAENGLVELGVLEVLNIIAKDPTQCTNEEIEKANKLCAKFGTPSITKEKGGCPVCGTPCDIVGHTTKHYEPKISKEQLLAILPEKQNLTVHGHENCPECNKVGRNQAIDQMKQRIEELWKVATINDKEKV